MKLKQIPRRANPVAIACSAAILVIRKLRLSKAGGLEGHYAATNLCVAYLKVGAMDNAEEACDLAVASIREVIATNSGGYPNSGKSHAYRTFLAAALSNRGVFFAVNDRPELARKDFHAAIDVNSRNREAEINLAGLMQPAVPAACT